MPGEEEEDFGETCEPALFGGDGCGGEVGSGGGGGDAGVVVVGGVWGDGECCADGTLCVRRSVIDDDDADFPFLPTGPTAIEHPDPHVTGP